MKAMGATALDDRPAVRFLKLGAPMIAVLMLGWVAPWALAQLRPGAWSRQGAGLAESLAFFASLAALGRAERFSQAISAFAALVLWLCGLLVVWVRYWGS